ncbi:F-box protein At3g59000-like [Lotus japonicus]|uniref:F-box protein At3g59000-like n=1 Tax=Lotus japonicus TaxID=34305 RepID=UPI00258555DD|nr:F-box protein At3g59000-like [Lotus japonicus]
MEDFNTDVDHISILPEEIIHNILGRLTMLDIIRTSCLSKAWNSFGVSLPCMNIDNSLRAIPLEWFKDFMHRKVSSMGIQGKPLILFKIKLCLDHLLVYKAREEIERCMKLVFETCTIKEFVFHITSTGARYDVTNHDLYAFFHHIYNAETLNVLRLSGMSLAQPSGVMKLSSLQSLSLQNVKLHDQSGIDWFFAACPMIRELRLIDCNHLEHLKVSGLSHLKHLEIDSCNHLTSVEIQSPGLVKLVLSEIKRRRLDNFILGLEIDSQTCETLKELTLCNSTIRGSIFSRMFSGCTNVESLVLDNCVHFFKITILSQKLKKLAIRRCFDVLITDINAPNLTSFSFCNFCWYDSSLSFPIIEKIIHQQDCMIDFNHTLMTKSIWISLWFDKFKDVQGQKMVIYPESDRWHDISVVIVLEDWSSMAELPLMTKICEEAAKTTITTMSFLDLADYVLESNQREGNKLENVITILSTDESKFYKTLKKKRPTISCKRCSSREIVNNDNDGFPYQALLRRITAGTMKAIRFSIPSL